MASTACETQGRKAAGLCFLISKRKWSTSFLEQPLPFQASISTFPDDCRSPDAQVSKYYIDLSLKTETVQGKRDGGTQPASGLDIVSLLSVNQEGDGQVRFSDLSHPFYPHHYLLASRCEAGHSVRLN